jgi:hypothetical protein
MFNTDIEKELPDFAKAVAQAKENNVEDIILHHSAFDETETDLLGRAIKYATTRGVNIIIVAK